MERCDPSLMELCWKQSRVWIRPHPYNTTPLFFFFFNKDDLSCALCLCLHKGIFFSLYSGSTKHIYVQMRQHLVGVTAFGVLFWAGVRSRAKTSHFQEQMNATQDYPLTHLKTA